LTGHGSRAAAWFDRLSSASLEVVRAAPAAQLIPAFRTRGNEPKKALF